MAEGAKLQHAALEAVARDVAHDLNNVFAVVVGNLEYLEHSAGTGAVEGAVLLECVREMLAASRRGDILVRRLEGAVGVSCPKA